MSWLNETLVAMSIPSVEAKRGASLGIGFRPVDEPKLIGNCSATGYTFWSLLGVTSSHFITAFCLDAEIRRNH